MAYLDLRAPFAVASLQAPSAPREASFDKREWQVIGLARNDRLSSLGEPGRLARIADWLFGAGVNPRLADPRLETLRRLAVLAWHHGYAVPVSAMKAFKAAGFSRGQLELLLGRVAAMRAASDRRAAA